MSYRFARRAFLSGVGAAFGLQILLRNLEAMAEGATSPPRLLVLHWPIGTFRARFLPSGAGSSFELSPILRPFETAGLKDDMIVLFGLRDTPSSGGGGGHEAGTVLTMTGAACPGTRRNGGEADDALAGGPSWDQIFLKHVAALQRPGAGYANLICDARVDSLETSTQCLSYSHQKRAVTTNSGSSVLEAIPLLPELSPARAYAKLFSGFVPGGATPRNTEAVLMALRMRKSALDHSLRELARLKTLAPAEEAPKIEVHAQAIRAVEKQLEQQIANGVAPIPGCTLPPAPDPALMGQTGSRFDYHNPRTTVADDARHEQIGKLHAAIIRAAFQCDLLRVATLQWSPGTNHVSFQGLFPGEPDAVYMHHPISHSVSAVVYLGDPPTATGTAEPYEFLCNVQTWYNQKTADILADFKAAEDAFGGKLLDHTIVPFLTEVAHPEHARTPKPGLIFGGAKLGMRGGQFLNFDPVRPQNDLWLTIAQAYFGTSTPLERLAGESFETNDVGVIPGLWSARS
jgi:hypothetical protein